MTSRRRRTASLALAALLMLAAAGPAAAAPADPGAARAEWMTGFVKLEAADKATADNNLMAALPLYKEALDIFEGVRRKYPQWNPSLLNYRVNYCQQNIEKLESRIQSDASALSRDDLLALSDKQAKTLQALQEDNRSLTAKVAVLSESIERARQEAAKTAGQETAAAELAAAKTALEQKVSLLELRLRETLEANTRLQGQSKFQEQAARLAAELTQAQARNQQLTGETTTLRADHDAATAKIAELTRQLEWRQRQQTDQETALKVARELAAARKTENDNLMTRLAAAEGKRELAEKNARDKDQEAQRLLNQHNTLTAEAAELRRFRDRDSENQKTILQQQEAIAARNRELLAARQDAETLTRRLEERNQDLAQRSQELAAARQQADDAIIAKLTSAEAKQALAEKAAAERDQDVQRLRSQLERQNTELAELRQARAATPAQTPPAEAAKTETARRDLATLRDNLAVLNERLITKETELKQRDDDLARTSRELEQTRAQAVIKEEKNLELLTATERLKTRLTQAESQNQRLAAQLQEATLVRDKTVTDARSRLDQAAAAQQQAQLATAALTEAERRLHDQTTLARRQENQIADLEKTVRDQTTQLTTAKQDAVRALDEWNRKLELQAAEVKDRAQVMAKLQVENQDLQTRLADLDRMQTALNEKLDAQNRLLEQQQKTITGLTQNPGQKSHVDNLQNLADQQIALLKQEKADLSRRNQELTQALAGHQTTAAGLKAALDAVPGQEQLAELQATLQARNDQLQHQEQLIANLKKPGDQTDQLIRSNLDLQQSLAKANQAAAAADDLGKKLRQQADGATEQNRLLREEIARQNQTALAANAEQTRLQAAKLAAETEAAEAKQRLQAALADAARQNSAIAEGRQNHQEQTRKLAATEDMVATLQKENKFLAAKTEAVDGMAKTLAETTAELQKNHDLLAELQKQTETLRDKNLDLDQQVKAKEDIIARLQSAPQTPDAWVARLQEINARLDKETQRRKALETALVDVENRRNADSPAAVAPARAASTGDDAQSSENRIRYEQERTAMLRGFLRQGLDAERQQKFEAAQWNYQKVLELESDNHFALQRLGIIAANSGNDQDTLRYLQQAFRQNPDDLDTLLALGFAQVRQSQPDGAVSSLGRAVSLHPDNVNAARAYGIALLTMGWTQAAEIQLKKAYQMKPEDPETAFNLAVLLATANPPRLPEAAQWYQTAVKNGAQPDPGLDAALKSLPTP